MAHPIPLYGVAMQEALASGDSARMREVLDRADREGSDDPEVRSLAGRIRAELSRTSSGGGATQQVVPPYGVAIHQAIVSGDLSRMKTLATEAEDYLRQTGDVRVALEQLKLEIERLSQRS